MEELGDKMPLWTPLDPNNVSRYHAHLVKSWRPEMKVQIAMLDSECFARL
jgi:hypothetical protein